MWPKSYAQRLHRVAERLDAVDRTRLATSLGMVEYAQCGTGPPLLVSHGIFGGFDAALHHADTYVGDGFGVIAPSRFGYLGSTISADATVSGQADAYAALLDHLGVDRAALFAFSAGSVSALRFALRYPDRTAALVIASGHYPQRHHKVPASLLGAVYNDRVFWALNTFMPRRLWGSPPGSRTASSRRPSRRGRFER